MFEILKLAAMIECKLSRYDPERRYDRDVVVSGKAGCGGERLKAAIAPVAVMMAAVANKVAILGLNPIAQNAPFIQV